METGVQILSVAPIFLGDKHNFGRSVSKVGRFIEKPRPIFWERFFLDKSFLFRKYLTVALPEIEEIVNSAFGEIDGYQKREDGIVLTPFLGMSGSAETEKYISEKSIAKLLTCSFMFGIEDLHSENFVAHAGRPQIVDIEAVFSRFQVVQETSLLAFPNANQLRTGLSCFGNVPRRSRESKVLIIEEVLKAYSIFKNHSSELERFLFENQKLIRSQKVRVLLKPTIQYLEAIKKHVFNGFAIEESIQLLRGDIPYFYGYPGSEELFFYADVECTPVSVTSKDLLTHPRAMRALKDASPFLHKRIAEDFPTFLASLVKTLFSSTALPVESSIFSIKESAPEKFEFISQQTTFVMLSKTWR